MAPQKTEPLLEESFLGGPLLFGVFLFYLQGAGLLGWDVDGSLALKAVSWVVQWCLIKLLRTFAQGATLVFQPGVPPERCEFRGPSGPRVWTRPAQDAAVLEHGDGPCGDLHCGRGLRPGPAKTSFFLLFFGGGVL